jgi:hypothetical protein
MLFCGLLASLAAGSVVAQESVRVTASVEMPQLRPFLQRVARSCSKGFTRDEASRLAGDINALATEKAGNWEFTAVCKGETQQLKVRALVDELSRVELDFLTSATLATEIRQALTGLPAR